MVSPPGRAEAIRRAAELGARLGRAVRGVVRGKDAVVELALVALFTPGHLLLEDVPGVGKTTLATALARALGGAFRRVQFTSDLLPADILGVNVLDAAAPGGFRFRPGPIFAHVLLADELNRATPKTQSALLEAMSEGAVTVDGVRHPLPRPFVVLATRNPEDHHGTFPLPDSQLDRFLLHLSMGYPDREAERAVLRSGGLPRARFERVASPEELAEALGAVDLVAMHPDVEEAILELADRSRADARLVRGISTRAAGDLYRACRALALLRGRAHVIPEDLRELAVPVLAHRVLPRTEGDGPRAAARRAIRGILDEIPSPL